MVFAGTIMTKPYSYFEWLQGFFIVHSTIGNTVHSMPLHSLEHWICTTTMTNIFPDRDSNLVPPRYKPQSIRMSHRADRASWTCMIISMEKHLFGLHGLYKHISALSVLMLYILYIPWRLKGLKSSLTYSFALSVSFEYLCYGYFMGMLWV